MVFARELDQRTLSRVVPLGRWVKGSALMSGTTRRCYRCETTFDGGNSVSSSCPSCGTMVFEGEDSRATLIPQNYGPGAIIEGHDRPTPRTLPAVDPGAKTVALGPEDVVLPSEAHFPQV